MKLIKLLIFLSLILFETAAVQIPALGVPAEEPSEEIHWNGKNTRGEQLSSGVYFYRLKAGRKVLTKKMVLLN